MQTDESHSRLVGAASGGITRSSYGRFTMSWQDGHLWHEVSGSVPHDEIGCILLSIQQVNDLQQRQWAAAAAQVPQTDTAGATNVG